MKKKAPKKTGRKLKDRASKKPASKKKKVSQRPASRKIKVSGKMASKKKPSSPVLKKKKVSQKFADQKKKIVAKVASKKKLSSVSSKKKVSKTPVSQKVKASGQSAAVIKGGKFVPGNLLKKPVKVSSQSSGFHSKTHFSEKTIKKPFSKFDNSKMLLKPKSVNPTRKKMSKLEEITISWVQEALQKIQARREEKRLIVKDMEGRDYCVFEDCDFPAVSGDYCRLHYIGRWDYIRIREKILKSDFIEKQIQELLKLSSSSCIMYFIGDFRSEKSFLTSIKPFLEDLDNLDDETLFVDEIKGDSVEKKSKERESNAIVAKK